MLFSFYPIFCVTWKLFVVDCLQYEYYPLATLMIAWLPHCPLAGTQADMAPPWIHSWATLESSPFLPGGQPHHSRWSHAISTQGGVQKKIKDIPLDFF